MNHFPEEIVVEILCRLPLRSLHRFKWVSKSWAQLITHRVLPSIPSSPLLGFFYYPTGWTRTVAANPAYDINIFANISTDPDITAAASGVDTKLSFLPPPVYRGSFWCPSPSVIGCSNGLLLCKSGQCYYVCNPATRSWTELEGADRPNYMLLDFDARLSPHYRVVAVGMRQGLVSIGVLCSKTGRWQRRRVDCGVRVFPSSESATIWDGAVYLFAYFHSVDGVSSKGKPKVVRFGLLEGDSGIEIIEPPTEVVKYCASLLASYTISIGKFRNKLCFACLDAHLSLSIWSLQGNHDTDWLMEHNSTIVNPITLVTNDQQTSVWVVGFHPLLDAVLIQSRSIIFAYDPENASFDEVCQIPSAVTDDVAIATLFPFSPCSFDLLENHID